MTPPIRMVSVPASDWSEYQDDISDAISDSIDMDWSANDGARAVVHWLNEHAPLTAAPVREEGGAVTESAWEVVRRVSKLIVAGGDPLQDPAFAKYPAIADLVTQAQAALATREEAPAEAGEDDGLFLLMKRDLYYRPNAMGYTGIKDNAGRYTEAEAASHADEASGVTAIRASDAPDFSPACFDDLARQHLAKKLGEARRENAALRVPPQARSGESQ